MRPNVPRVRACVRARACETSSGSLLPRASTVARRQWAPLAHLDAARRDGEAIGELDAQGLSRARHDVPDG
eukprot:3442622-Prymnesium_polylepis.2